MTTSDWIAISSVLIAIVGGFGTVAIILFRFLFSLSNVVTEIKTEVKGLSVAIARIEQRLDKHDKRLRRVEKKLS